MSPFLIRPGVWEKRSQIALAPAVGLDGALDLIGSRRGTPMESLGKVNAARSPRHRLLRPFRKAAHSIRGTRYVQSRDAPQYGASEDPAGGGGTRAMVQREEAPKAAGTPLASREWALVALLAVAFAPAVLAMADVWTHVDYQSHGFLVPVVAVWLALRQRYALRRLPVEPAGAGLAVLAAAFVAYFSGIIGGSVPLQGAALVVAIAGAVLFARGTAWLRRLAIPARVPALHGAGPAGLDHAADPAAPALRLGRRRRAAPARGRRPVASATATCCSCRAANRSSSPRRAAASRRW